MGREGGEGRGRGVFLLLPVSMKSVSWEYQSVYSRGVGWGEGGGRLFECSYTELLDSSSFSVFLVYVFHCPKINISP